MKKLIGILDSLFLWERTTNNRIITRNIVLPYLKCNNIVLTSLEKKWNTQRKIIQVKCGVIYQWSSEQWQAKYYKWKWTRCSWWCTRTPQTLVQVHSRSLYFWTKVGTVYFSFNLSSRVLLVTFRRWHSDVDIQKAKRDQFTIFLLFDDGNPNVV